MARRFVLALLSLVISCPFCPAQTTTVDVVDKSTVNCAVRLSGTVEFTESEVQGKHHTSFASHFSATNLSNQPIVAMVTETIIGNSQGALVDEHRQLDAFFSHRLEIAPGQTKTEEHPDNGKFISPVSEEAFKVAPAASSQLIFVQYADGSSCGNIKDGQVSSLMDTRADLLQALKKFNDAAKMGESQFLIALADKATVRTENAECILGNIRDMQKSQGSTAAIEYIRSMLNVAASR